MKKVLLVATTAVMALTSVSAHAAPPAQPINDNWSLECGLIRVSPPDRDRDPGFKINISISPEEGFVVTHTMISGAIYDRTDQYENLRSWKGNSDSYQWSGRSVKYPQVVMVGTLSRDRSGQLAYVEEIYKAGSLQTTVRSTCHLADEAKTDLQPPIPAKTLPACESTSTIDTLERVVEQSYRGRNLGIKIFRVDSRTLRSTAGKKFCAALLWTSAGKQVVNYTVEWLNHDTGQFWVEFRWA